MSRNTEIVRRRTTAGVLAVALAMFMVLAVLLGAVFGGTGSAKHTRAVFSTKVTATDVIRFNEFMTDNATCFVLGSVDLPDWIELKNTSLMDVSLENYSVMRASKPTEIFALPKIVIPAGGYVLLYADGHQERTTVSEIHLPFKLPSSGETVVLLNPSAEVIDSVEVVKLDTDCVYALDDMGEWHVSTTPTPGSENRITEMPQEVSEVQKQLEQANELTVQPDVVYITEVMSANMTYAPDSLGRCHDYVELYNSADFDVSLAGWHLSDDRTDAALWTFPDNANIPSHGRLLVYCGGAAASESNTGSDLIASFRLNANGCQVLLVRSDGQCISMIDVPLLEKDQAYALVNGVWTKNSAPTPGQSNNREGQVALDAKISANNVYDVRLNEIAAATTTMDYDWIELYNGGTVAVDLSGYGLSDNPAKPRKWQFPEGSVIQPGQYVGVYCSGLDGVSGGAIHTNFKLSKSGGYTVVLSRPDGTVFDQAYVQPQFTNISMGRRQDADGWWYFTEATPLSANTTPSYNGKASSPAYSVRGGLFDAGTTLEVALTAPEEGMRIYYTLDNTDPTEASMLYTAPITITDTTILRTRVYGDNYLESYMDTQSYLYNVNNGNGVYVVSLVSDPYNLTSGEAGIMILGDGASSEYPYKGANFWNDWEREAHVEVYGGDGSQVLSAECGIKLHGQYSRAEDQQAFKVIARAAYGTSEFEAALFSNRPYTSYQSFLLRSSGQDTTMTRMRDSVLQTLAADTSVMYQESEICVLYLDGQYWGQYYLRERINTSSICQFENWEGQKDSLDLIKANRNVMQGSNETYAEMLEWVKTADPTSDGFYSHIEQYLDIRNYIEYMAIEIFVGNGDTLNVKRYRNQNADGKWRWVLFDLDWAFYVDTDSINRWLSPGGMGTGKYTDNTLFIACMKNPRFRDEFLTYMGERMATVFTTDNVLSKFETRYAELQPLLPEQLARWGQTESDYSSALKKLIEYCKTRPGRLIEFFAGTKYLNLTEAEMQKYFGDAMAVIANSEN